MMHTVFFKNESLFPNLNYNLMKDLMKLGERDSQTIFTFQRDHQLEYIGEVAERWEQRGLFKDIKDALSAILTISMVNTSGFYYEQRKMFARTMAESLKERSDNNLPTSVALLYYAKEAGIGKIENMEELQPIVDFVLKNKQADLTPNENIMVIGLGSMVAKIMKKEEWNQFLYHRIDQLKIQLSNPDEDYPLLLLLSNVFYDLEKPKAKNFKTKGITTLLSSISSLRNKEVNDEQLKRVMKIFNVSEKGAATLNQLLSRQSSEYKKITDPGEDRITKRYLKSQLLGNEEVSEAFKEDYPSVQMDSYFLLNSLNDFPNKENLKFFISKIDERRLINHSNLSYIELLKDSEDSVFSSSQREKIVKKLVTEYTLEEDEFLFLENERKTLSLEIGSDSSYIKHSIKYNTLDVNDIQFLEEKKLLQEVVKQIPYIFEVPKYLEYMEKLDTEFHSDIVHRFYTYEEKLIQSEDNENLKKLYELHLKALFQLKPETYISKVYKFLQDEKFLQLFEYTKEDVEKIEKELFEADVLSDSIREEVRIKYTSQEALEQERIEKIIKSLEDCDSKYDLERWTNRHSGEATTNVILQNALVNQILGFEYDGKHEVESILYLFFKLKAKKVLTSEQEVQIDEFFVEKVTSLI